MQAASKGKEFSTFYVWEDTRVISLKLFLLIHTSPSGASILSSPSRVSSGLTEETGCSLIAAREQVFFSFPEFSLSSWWGVAAV